MQRIKQGMQCGSGRLERYRTLAGAGCCSRWQVRTVRKARREARGPTLVVDRVDAHGAARRQAQLQQPRADGGARVAGLGEAVGDQGVHNGIMANDGL